MAGRNSLYKEPAIIVCELVLQPYSTVAMATGLPAVSLESRLVSRSQPLPLQARGQGEGLAKFRLPVLIVFNEDHCVTLSQLCIALTVLTVLIVLMKIAITVFIVLTVLIVLMKTTV